MIEREGERERDREGENAFNCRFSDVHQGLSSTTLFPLMGLKEGFFLTFSLL